MAATLDPHRKIVKRRFSSSIFKGKGGGGGKGTAVSGPPFVLREPRV